MRPKITARTMFVNGPASDNDDCLVPWVRSREIVHRYRLRPSERPDCPKGPAARERSSVPNTDTCTNGFKDNRPARFAVSSPNIERHPPVSHLVEDDRRNDRAKEEELVLADMDPVLTDQDDRTMIPITITVSHRKSTRRRGPGWGGGGGGQGALTSQFLDRQCFEAQSMQYRAAGFASRRSGSI